MLTRNSRLALLGLSLLTAACSTTRPLPKYETPLARAAVQHIRTTAYTHTESDHLQYGCLSACGTRLQCGPVNSAAADWSRWPNGTMFRIAETGEIYQVDDYGWALAGTNTIDLYKPSREAMNGWGTRRVTIELLQWGDAWRSHSLLKSRSHYAHVRRMLDEIEHRYARNSTGPAPVVAAVSTPPIAPAAPPVQYSPPTAPPTQMVSTAPGPSARSAAPLTPFYR